jgi:hypothetical protein
VFTMPGRNWFNGVSCGVGPSSPFFYDPLASDCAPLAAPGCGVSTTRADYRPLSAAGAFHYFPFGEWLAAGHEFFCPAMVLPEITFGVHHHVGVRDFVAHTFGQLARSLRDMGIDDQQQTPTRVRMVRKLQSRR